MRAWLCLALTVGLAACDRSGEADAPDAASKPEIGVVTTDPNIQLRKTYPDGVYEPQRGDAERKALLDAVRPKVAAELGVPFAFAVSKLRVSGDWAFAILEPQRPGGAPLYVDDTKLKDEEGEFDGLRTEVIWRKKAGAWVVDKYAIGATDVWYEPECKTAPKGLIPFCSGGGG